VSSRFPWCSYALTPAFTGTTLFFSDSYRTPQVSLLFTSFSFHSLESRCLVPPPSLPRQSTLSNPTNPNFSRSDDSLDRWFGRPDYSPPPVSRRCAILVSPGPINLHLQKTNHCGRIFPPMLHMFDNIRPRVFPIAPLFILTFFPNYIQSGHHYPPCPPSWSRLARATPSNSSLSLSTPGLLSEALSAPAWPSVLTAPSSPMNLPLAILPL